MYIYIYIISISISIYVEWILMVMVGPKSGGLGPLPRHFWRGFHPESPGAKSNRSAKKRARGGFLKRSLLIDLVPHHRLPLQFLGIIQKSTAYLARKTYQNTSHLRSFCVANSGLGPFSAMNYTTHFVGFGSIVNTFQNLSLMNEHHSPATWICMREPRF